MSLLEILGALLGMFVGALAIGFLVEAANAFGDVRPEPYTEAELKALVRRHFQSAPIPDDSEQLLAEFISEGS